MANSKMKIMAIDDNSINLAAIEQKLKDEYEIIPMINGKRAIKYLYCEKVDLILLDVQMPMLDGVETLKEIRKLENGVTIPVIFLTAMKDKYTVIEGSKLGIMDYITKPFEIDDLKKRIDFAFKRVGIRPMEDEELLGCVKLILEDLEESRFKQATNRMDELTGYQIDDEIIGRVRNARNKLDMNDSTAALKVIEKIYQMLKQLVGTNPAEEHKSISAEDMKKILIIIREALEKYRTKEAIVECQKLMRFKLADDIAEKVNQLHKMLMEYDDEEANKILEELLADM